MSISPAPQLVLKVSKYCNLRCSYCYEFPHLGDKARMSLETVETLFENVRRSADDLGIEQLEFVWHGGEPLLVPAAFYEQVAEIQDRIFSTNIRHSNAVQTNLTLLTDRHLALLESGFFSKIGVSFDVYGDQRVDTMGRLRTDAVLNHLQRLIDRRIPFSAIAVLARDTRAHVRRIYRFFDDLGISHRVLAYYRSAGGEQAERHGLDFDELVGAYTDLFHEWLGSERATPVVPIADFVRWAAHHLRRGSSYRFDRSREERVFIVDVNGDVYSDVESYDPEFRYGNLRTSPFSEVVASDAARRSRVLSDERTRRFCEQCPYFGSCPGAYVANATLEKRKLLETRGCAVRRVLDHVVGVFESTGLDDLIRGAHGADLVAEGSRAVAATWPQGREDDGAPQNVLEAPGLARPVQIHLPDDGRIELSAGTRAVDPSEVEDGYQPGARLPREPWRAPTAEEATSLVSRQPPRDMARSVCIVQLPALSAEDREALRVGRDGAIERALLAPLRSLCELGEPLSCIGPSHDPPGLRTTTVERRSGRFIGLHVDDWDKLDAKQRTRATNRVCVNIGEHPRHFLFLPFSVAEIAGVVGETMGSRWSPPRPYTLLGRAFMARFPHVPVVRCRLAPGEAYIAPTENLFHDAAFEEPHGLDEKFTVRGRIRLHGAAAALPLDRH